MVVDLTLDGSVFGRVPLKCLQRALRVVQGFLLLDIAIPENLGVC